MQTITVRSLPGRSRTFLGSSRSTHARHIGVWLSRMVNVLVLWQERAQQRTHLAELPDYLLRDLGLGRADVDRECRKPFWRA